MGRIRVITRLVARDLRRRRGEAVLMLITIMAASTTLTLGLILHGVTSQPYAQTRAATRGPDVVANVFPTGPGTGKGPTESNGVSARQLAALTTLDHAPGVTGHSGPYPVTWALLRAHGTTATAEVEGRDAAAASLDQPKLTQGSWVHPGEVVVERSFADALGIGAGDRMTLNGRSFRVAGVAVTAAFVPYPNVCFTGCIIKANETTTQPGLVWVTSAAARGLASTGGPLTYFLNLKLAHPGRADAFANTNTTPSASAPFLTGWQDISQQDGNVVRAMVVDARRSSAVARALGATPGQVSAGLSGVQVLPALIGALLGIPGGFGLVSAIRHSAGSVITTPPIWWLAAVVLGTVVVVAALTAVPARIGARRSVAVVLQTE